MPALLTTASRMMCPHGGWITGIAGDARILAETPALHLSDAFVISGCPFVEHGRPNPCVTVEWVVGAGRVDAAGTPLLNDAAVGLCLDANEDPQGMVLVVSTQDRVSVL